MASNNPNATIVSEESQDSAEIWIPGYTLSDTTDIENSETINSTPEQENEDSVENWIPGYTLSDEENYIVESTTLATTRVANPIDEDMKKRNANFHGRAQKEKYRNKIGHQERASLKCLLPKNFKFRVLHIHPIYDSLKRVIGQTSFVIVGDQKGRFGYSFKFNSDRATSIKEAIEDAIAKTFSLNLISYKCKTKNRNTIPFSCTGRSGNTYVTLTPSYSGCGLQNAGGIVKQMLQMTKIDDCEVKVINNPKFIGYLGRATYEALYKLKTDAKKDISN